MDDDFDPIEKLEDDDIDENNLQEFEDNSPIRESTSLREKYDNFQENKEKWKNRYDKGKELKNDINEKGFKNTAKDRLSGANPMKGAGKDAAKQAGQGAAKQAGQGAAKQAGGAAAKAAGGEAAKQAGSAAAKQAGAQVAKQAGKTVAKEAGKTAVKAGAHAAASTAAAAGTAGVSLAAEAALAAAKAAGKVQKKVLSAFDKMTGLNLTKHRKKINVVATLAMPFICCLCIFMICFSAGSLQITHTSIIEALNDAVTKTLDEINTGRPEDDKITLATISDSQVKLLKKNIYEIFSDEKSQLYTVVEGIMFGNKPEKQPSAKNATAGAKEVATRKSRYNANVPNIVEQNALEGAGTSLGTFEITAYCSCRICCDQYSPEVTGKPSQTASGTFPKQGRTIATDPRVIKTGQHVLIKGHEYIAEDTGGAIKGNRIDMYFESHQEALAWGRQSHEVFSNGVFGIDAPTTGGDSNMPSYDITDEEASKTGSRKFIAKVFSEFITPYLLVEKENFNKINWLEVDGSNGKESKIDTKKDGTYDLEVPKSISGAPNQSVTKLALNMQPYLEQWVIPASNYVVTASPELLKSCMEEILHKVDVKRYVLHEYKTEVKKIYQVSMVEQSVVKDDGTTGVIRVPAVDGNGNYIKTLRSSSSSGEVKTVKEVKDIVNAETFWGKIKTDATLKSKDPESKSESTSSGTVSQDGTLIETTTVTYADTLEEGTMETEEYKVLVKDKEIEVKNENDTYPTITRIVHVTNSKEYKETGKQSYGADTLDTTREYIKKYHKDAYVKSKEGNFGNTLAEQDGIGMEWPVPDKDCQYSNYYFMDPTRNNHTGIDIPGGGRGSGIIDIIATLDGEVEKAGPSNSGYGTQILLKHSDGYQTRYAHLSVIKSGLKPGTKVKAGDVIGKMGTTGNSTGVHLHYEVIKNGAHVDPFEFYLYEDKYSSVYKKTVKYFKGKISNQAFNFGNEITDEMANKLRGNIGIDTSWLKTLPGQHGRFIEFLYPYAIQAGEIYGIVPSVLLAQTINESAPKAIEDAMKIAKGELTEGLTMLGITKDGNPAHGYADTKGVTHAYTAYYKRVISNGMYPQCMQVVKNKTWDKQKRINMFVTGLKQGPYCNDVSGFGSGLPSQLEYERRLLDTIRRYQLDKFDSLSFSMGAGNGKYPPYIQTDPKWGGISVNYGGGSSTIGRAACGPTSCAILLVGQGKVIPGIDGVAGRPKDGVMDPVEVTTWAAREGHWKGLAYWSMFPAVAKFFGPNASKTYVQIGDDGNKALELLKKGYIGTVSTNSPSYFTRGGHIIAAIGAEGNKIKIQDPASLKRSKGFTPEFMNAEGGVAAYFLWKP